MTTISSERGFTRWPADAPAHWMGDRVALFLDDLHTSLQREYRDDPKTTDSCRDMTIKSEQRVRDALAQGRIEGRIELLWRLDADNKAFVLYCG